MKNGFERIWAIINDGAQAYRGVIPINRCAEPSGATKHNNVCRRYIQETDMGRLNSNERPSAKVLWLLALTLPLVLVACPAPGQSPTVRPITIFSQVEKGSITYRLNGSIVEDKPDNALIKRLTEIARARGTNVPVILVIDTHAQFSEVGKLETALDKVGFSDDIKIYVANFVDKTMNQVHWDPASKPLP